MQTITRSTSCSSSFLCSSWLPTKVRSSGVKQGGGGGEVSWREVARGWSSSGEAGRGGTTRWGGRENRKASQKVNVKDQITEVGRLAVSDEVDRGRDQNIEAFLRHRVSEHPAGLGWRCKWCVVNYVVCGVWGMVCGVGWCCKWSHAKSDGHK